MATTTVETVIANPARKRRKNVARRMSLKQKLHFGTARQRASAQQSLKRSRAAKRAAKHRKRPNPRRRPNALRHRIGAAVHHVKRGSVRKAAKSLFRKRRHNPGEIIALTSMNPARRSMARTHRRRRASSHRAGHRRIHHRRQPAMRHHRRSRRHNPGQLGAMVRTAAWTGVGFFGSMIGTQAVLGAGNTGITGYVGNAVATGILSFATHMFTKKPADSFAVGVGGVLNILRRIVSDNSLIGQYSSQLGMGDYLVANWWVPQRLDGNPFSLGVQQYDMNWLPQQQIPISSAAPAGMGYLPAPIPNLYGNDLY